MPEWASWAYDMLVNDTNVTDVVPAADIHGGASIEGRKENKPFIIIRMGAENPELEGDDLAHSSRQFMDIWVHDNPGSYKRINGLLFYLFGSMSGPVQSLSGAVQCRWAGNSPQLSDEGYGTITRYISFELIGTLQ